MILRDLIDLVSRKKRNKEKVTTTKIALGMAALSALGAIVGILFAPKAGKETREDLKKKATNSVETIKYTVKKNAETMKDFAEHAEQEISSDIKDVNEINLRGLNKS